MQKTTPLKSGVALFCGVWFDAYSLLALSAVILPEKLEVDTA